MVAEQADCVLIQLAVHLLYVQATLSNFQTHYKLYIKYNLKRSLLGSDVDQDPQNLMNPVPVQIQIFLK